MGLLLKDKILKTSRIDILNNYIVVGTTANELHGVMANCSDKLSILEGPDIIRTINLECQVFHTFNEGILFQTKEGSPVKYTNFDKKIIITKSNFFIKPIHQRSTLKNALIIEMDSDFNQKYYILSQNLDYSLTDEFPKILGEDKFIFYDKSKVNVFNLTNKKLVWDLAIPQIEQVERRNQGRAVFTDQDYVFIRFAEGKLKCLSKLDGNVFWAYKPPFKEVSYGEIDNGIYVHTGKGIIELNKKTGKEVRSVNYIQYDELAKFRSDGTIWCWKEIILTKNSFSGEIAVFSRSSFELIDYQVVDIAGIPESVDCIRFKNNCLYVLSVSSTLHIYELKSIANN